MDYFGSSDENKKIFDTMPNLKCVSTVSAGYDHLGMVIDYLSIPYLTQFKCPKHKEYCAVY